MNAFTKAFCLLIFLSFFTSTIPSLSAQNLDVDHNTIDVAQFKSTTGTTRVNLDGNYLIGGSEKRSFLEANNTIFRLSTSNNNTAGQIRFATSGTGSSIDHMIIAADGTITINNAYELPTTDGAAGEVLTTNGAGVASWQSGGGTTGPNSGFRAELNTLLNVPYSTNTDIVDFFEATDTNNDFNPSTGVFTAPVSGFYHFDAHIYMESTSAVDQKEIEVKFCFTGAATSSSITNDRFSVDAGGFGDSTDFSTNIYLNAGSTVSLRIFHQAISGVNLPVTNTGRTTFSGFRIY